MTYDYAAIVALADPTRRKVFEMIAERPRSVVELTRSLPVSQPAVSHHLKVLKEAQLVRAEPRGASNIYHLDPQGLGQMRAWLDRMWADALDAFRKEINATQEKEKEKMNVMIKPAPVQTSVTVDAPLARAFEVFTAGFGRWWPSTHSIGKSPINNAIIEPRSGGRWYEIGEDGSECEWGEVLGWEPPTRVLLAWRIGIDWQYDPRLLTEVDIRFTAIGEGSTRVDLEHRLLENMGEAAEKAREIFGSEGGWPGLLAKYQAEVAKSAGR